MGRASEEEVSHVLATVSDRELRCQGQSSNTAR
jgi:hypothetical protein